MHLSNFYLCLYVPFPLCASVYKFFSSYKDTSHWISMHPPPWPHLKLIPSTKTLFPKKVTFTSVRGKDFKISFTGKYNSPCNTFRSSCCLCTLVNYSLASWSYLQFFKFSMFSHLMPVPVVDLQQGVLLSTSSLSLSYLLKLKGHFLFPVNLFLPPAISQNQFSADSARCSVLLQTPLYIWVWHLARQIMTHCWHAWSFH